MTQATVGFRDANGNWVPVRADNPLPTSGGGSTGPTVTSVNAQTGDVVLDAASVGAAPASHTHAAADVTSGTFSTARIPNLAISKVTNLQTSLDAKQDSLPAAPSTGTYALQSIDGVLTWVEVV